MFGDELCCDDNLAATTSGASSTTRADELVNGLLLVFNLLKTRKMQRALSSLIHCYKFECSFFPKRAEVLILLDKIHLLSEIFE